jgi:hypothetical protein
MREVKYVFFQVNLLKVLYTLKYQYRMVALQDKASGDVLCYSCRCLDNPSHAR